MPRKEVDVLIIGLGPAGGNAALCAAKSGLSVLAIDRKKEIGYPVQCAEFIPLPLSQYANNKTIRLQSVYEMESVLPSGIIEKSKLNGLMIDRAQFDKSFADNAKQFGAVIQSGKRLLDLDRENQVAEIMNDASHSEFVSYRYLIAADGPNSTVAACLSLDKLSVIQTRQYTVSLLRKLSNTRVWLSNEYPGGYAWLFPKNGQANLGVGLDKNLESNLKKPLDSLHQQLIEKKWLGDTVLFKTGGVIPVSGLRNCIAMKNIFFVGDAAGLTHPITGAGISSAITSAQLAIEHIIENGSDYQKAMQNYHDDIHNLYQDSLRIAKLKRQKLANLWRAQAVDDNLMRQSWIGFDDYYQENVNQPILENEYE